MIFDALGTNHVEISPADTARKNRTAFMTIVSFLCEPINRRAHGAAGDGCNNLVNFESVFSRRFEKSANVRRVL